MKYEPRPTAVVAALTLIFASACSPTGDAVEASELPDRFGAFNSSQSETWVGAWRSGGDEAWVIDVRETANGDIYGRVGRLESTYHQDFAQGFVDGDKLLIDTPDYPTLMLELTDSGIAHLYGQGNRFAQMRMYEELELVKDEELRPPRASQRPFVGVWQTDPDSTLGSTEFWEYRIHYGRSNLLPDEEPGFYGTVQKLRSVSLGRGVAESFLDGIAVAETQAAEIKPIHSFVFIDDALEFQKPSGGVLFKDTVVRLVVKGTDELEVDGQDGPVLKRVRTRR